MYIFGHELHGPAVLYVMPDKFIRDLGKGTKAVAVTCGGDRNHAGVEGGALSG